MPSRIQNLVRENLGILGKSQMGQVVLKTRHQRHSLKTLQVHVSASVPTLSESENNFQEKLLIITCSEPSSNASVDHRPAFTVPALSLLVVHQIERDSSSRPQVLCLVPLQRLQIEETGANPH